MVKIHLENWLKFMTSLIKKEGYKLEGDWKCYFLEEPRRASFVQPSKSKACDHSLCIRGGRAVIQAPTLAQEHRYKLAPNAFRQEIGRDFKPSEV